MGIVGFLIKRGNRWPYNTVNSPFREEFKQKLNEHLSEMWQKPSWNPSIAHSDSGALSIQDHAMTKGKIPENDEKQIGGNDDEPPAGILVMWTNGT